MNILEFEIHDQILKRIDTQEVINRNKKSYKCKFTFENESEWVELNKFVIFEDGWGNSSVVHIGNGDVLECIIPEKILRGSYFKISVYAGDLMSTNYVVIALVQSGYTKSKRYYMDNRCHSWYDGEDIFVEIFRHLTEYVDSIVYDNKTLHFFNKESLIESVYLPFISEDEFEDLIAELLNSFLEERIRIATENTNGLMSSEDKAKLDGIEENANRIIVDTILDENSNNPIANGSVTRALNGKEDEYNIVERLDNLILDLINIDGE